MRFKIVSTGFFAPPRVETAADLAPRIRKSEAWIASRTGVMERRISDEPMDVMAARAVRQAMGDQPPPDLLLNASLTPLQLIPDSSVFIQRQLGWEGIPSFTVHATCMSFLVAMHAAGAYLASGAYRRIVVVSAEQGSVCRDYDHAESAALIGDGAAAALLEPTPDGEGSALLAWGMSTWPSGHDLAELRGCGTRHHPNDPTTRTAHNLFQMRGPRIYKMAVTKVEELVAGMLDRARLRPEDIDLVVPHQPSGPAVAAIPRWGFPEEKVVNIVGQYGNCIAASSPMTLHLAIETGRVQRGMRILMLGTGAGLHVAGAILRY